MNIAVLLPYKENFSKYNAGAVSIFVNDTNKLSKFKNKITVFGSTSQKNILDNYKNIEYKKNIFYSNSSSYLKKFFNKIKHKKIEIIEVHNRPHYIKYLIDLKNTKKILFFHNDPLNMQGSATVNERLKLLERVDKIVFNSNWSKSRFFINLPNSNLLSKISVIHQSTSKTKVDFKKKKKIISFIGKLNTSKGYDIFGNVIVKILNKYKDWSSIVIGNEPREKHIFKHKNLFHLGYQSNNYILKKLKEVSISVVPSKWDEPFGRSSMEAASRGSALIISNTGGLKETTDSALILNKINENELYKKIELLIKNVKLRKKLQLDAYNNFKLTNKNAAKNIDEIRTNLFLNKSNLSFKKNKILKILHITNFNERFDGRLHYNTSKRINNGLIRLGHNVLNISDRDIISNYKNLGDLSGIVTLNEKIIRSFENFMPDMVILGHADSVDLDTINLMREKNKFVKFSQWFLDPVSISGPDYKKNKNRFLKFSQYTDANFITTHPDAINFSSQKTFFLPNPADQSFETLNNYKNNCENDVFFAMSHGVHRGKLKKNKHDDREKILNKLLKNNNINFDFYGFNNKEPIWGNEFKNQLSNSKMGLNLSRGKPVKYYSSDRIAQLMGNGLLTLIDEKTCYSDFFNNNEIVTYKNISDLIEKILKYKRDDKKRRLIAKNGKKKYLNIFNSTDISDYIISKTFNFEKKFKWEI